MIPFLYHLHHHLLLLCNIPDNKTNLMQHNSNSQVTPSNLLLTGRTPFNLILAICCKSIEGNLLAMSHDHHATNI